MRFGQRSCTLIITEIKAGRSRMPLTLSPKSQPARESKSGFDRGIKPEPFPPSHDPEQELSPPRVQAWAAACAPQSLRYDSSDDLLRSGFPLLRRPYDS